MDSAAITKHLVIPEETVIKWQSIVNIIADIIKVPAALIMKAEPPYIKVFCSSESDANPYKIGDKELLSGGLYCETVIKKRDMLLIPNALEEEEWKNNPDIRLGMISYLGFPLILPDDKVFGTICVLDNKKNSYGEIYLKLMSQFRDLVESHLALLYQNFELEIKTVQLEKSLSEIKTLRGIIPICASCKKIRDDEGYWQAVEIYIHNHSDAKFSHGICPECIKKLYPELRCDT